MKSILVATDLSARSDRAVERAVAIANRNNARLCVAHVVDEELPASVAERQKDAAESALRSVIASTPDASAVRVDITVMFGEHYSTIIALAEKEAADLVVIGKHREDVLLDLFRGSTGERVLRFGTRPVLVVKERPSVPYVSVLAAVDFSPPCRKALEFAFELVPDGQFQLVHAFDIPFRGLLLEGRSFGELTKKHQQQFDAMVKEQMAEFLAKLSKPANLFSTIVRDGRPEEVVLSAIAETRPQLVVVGTHGRSGVGRAFLGSVAERVIARSPVDVLAVRGW
jgi:nucleotide-binding universal stress UspA family protein